MEDGESIPGQVINLKSFHCKIINDHEALKVESDSYKTIPEARKVDMAIIQRNYQQIKQEVRDIIETEMQNILNDPSRASMGLKK